LSIFVVLRRPEKIFERRGLRGNSFVESAGALETARGVVVRHDGGRLRV
jgi:hypothetical protein